MPRKIPNVIGHVQIGDKRYDIAPSLPFIQYLDDLENGGSGNPAIGTLLSGINSVTATTTAIVNGTQPLADVVISGVGSLTQIDAAQDANIAAASGAASAGALTASASPSFLYEESPGPGTITTDTVTITASGGTGPYTYAWAYLSGYASFSVSSATAAAVDFTSLSLNPGQSRSGVWRCTVTDSAAATFRVDVAITVVSTE